MGPVANLHNAHNCWSFWRTTGELHAKAFDIGFDGVLLDWGQDSQFLLPLPDFAQPHVASSFRGGCEFTAHVGLTCSKHLECPLFRTLYRSCSLLENSCPDFARSAEGGFAIFLVLPKANATISGQPGLVFQPIIRNHTISTWPKLEELVLEDRCARVCLVHLFNELVDPKMLEMLSEVHAQSGAAVGFLDGGYPTNIVFLILAKEHASSI
mmetsp:Transcript_66434/g.138749  ORF Transcript_66434/g.138749 Transcript_66434/m.138749 type:complete len:211 (+) Transcript_66434:386-1018(+)